MLFSALGNDTAYQQLRVKALEREIELLKTLDHKNIVKYLGTKRDKNSLNVILEFRTRVKQLVVSTLIKCEFIVCVFDGQNQAAT